jgi:hypothetical protein
MIAKLFLILLISVFINVNSSNYLKVNSVVNCKFIGEYKTNPILVHGGAIENKSVGNSIVKKSISSVLFASWGVFQVVALFGNAIRRLFPIAMEPFKQSVQLSPIQYIAYFTWIAFMIRAEGYEGFQKKFSPLLIKRAFLLNQNKTFLRCLLAGPYVMGLFGATKKRMIISWAVSVGVFGLVTVVKFLPYPYRSIVDAGVVAGLSYGTGATLFFFIRGLLGYYPEVDPCLPHSDRKTI